MSFNIQKFTSKINEVRGIAPVSKFEIYIWPNSERLKALNVNKELQFLAFSVDIPGFSFSPDLVMLNGYGRVNEVPIRLNTSDCDIQFYMDSNNHAYRFFYNWINFVSNSFGNNYKAPNAGFELMGYPSEYYSTIHILFKNHDHTPIFTTILLDAYPLELSGVNLDWNHENLLASAQTRIGFRAIQHIIT